jgi:DNA-directed RNA polymerase specialized sigma24 family protein
MDSPTSTFGLIERFKDGDSQAFDRLFELNRRRLAVLIHYKLSLDKRRSENVEEILQEVFLARIADHVITDDVRFQNRQKRRAELQRLRSDSYPQGADPADTKTPSRVLAQQEALDALLARLNALPEQYREVILLAKIEGLSTQEMADRLGKSRENVALLLHRAIQRFRELQSVGVGPPLKKDCR